MAKNEQKSNPQPTTPAKTEEVKKTPEQIAKEKANAEKRQAHTDARKRIEEYLSQFDLTKPEEKQLVDDIRLFIGKGGGQRTARVSTKSVNSAIRDAFLAAGDKGLTEMDIFKAFKIGRPEMVTKIRILVLCPNPDDRVWVKFDEEKETYFVVGKGAEPPKGWDGYVPAEKSDL